MTEGEFPIVPQSPAPHDAVPIPESGSESDSDRMVDYRDDPATLLALIESSDDVLLQLPDDFYVPVFVPLDGDGFASWLTRQDKIKAGSVTPEMARRYAKEIRMAKLDEFKSYLDNGALRLADKRKLSRDVNFLTGRWVLTVKVDKKRLLLEVQGEMGLSRIPGQACLGTANRQSYCYSLWFSFSCPVCGQQFLGFVSFGPEDCLPSGGTLQSRIAQCGNSVAT